MAFSEQSLVVGALVQWTVATTYGVIVGRDGRSIYVRWDRSPSAGARERTLHGWGLKRRQAKFLSCV